MTGRLLDGETAAGAQTRALLGTLEPAGPGALTRVTVHPSLLAESLSRTGGGPTGWAVEFAAGLHRDLTRRDRTSGRTELPGRARFVEALALWSVTALHGVCEPPAALTGEIDRIAGECAQAGTGPEAVLKCLRAAHAGLSSAFFGRCTETVGGVDQPAVMRELSVRLFDAVETVASLVAERWTAVSEERLNDPRARSAALVRSVLAGGPMPPAASLTARLGYDLGGRHIALVLWCRDHSGTGCATALENRARTLLERARSTSFLAVPAGPCGLWAWGGGAVDDRAIREAPPPAATGVHTAVSLPGRGLPGFREAHEQARAVERLARAAGSAPAVHDYTSVELALLLGEDLGRAAEFVARELGPLTAGGPAASALRTTVKSYLDHERSLSTASRELHVARNTVAYRVKKAEVLLGRSLRTEHLRLHVALQLAETLGTAVLAAPGGGERPAPRPG
ncbi:PucR family transcriptional regulator [Streptomyces sp. NPDC094448]|uniref:PucR family transcriptional regulator n=1 Tax=Streptomyces sp. NPDC094448 TaxID=3366063 RepID=UPI00381718E3